MGVALGRADGQSGDLGDLGEADIECVLERDHRRLSGRKLSEPAAELATGLRGCQLGNRVSVARGPLVLEERLRATQRARLGEVLAGIDGQAVEPGRELRLATKLADAHDELRQRVLCCVPRVLGIAEQVERQALDPRGVARAESLEGLLVACFGARHENRIGKPLVDERDIGAGISADWTTLGQARLHGAPTLVAVDLLPEAVLPRLHGAFGRTYLYANETPSTQTMAPPDAPNGTVALAEHQTAGRGRLGRVWVDEPGTGLALSVVLYPPPPVARWPELTLVAAHAVAGAIGGNATIKDPNDVLLDGKKVCGILAEAGERVVLGIGVNVGQAPWPGAGYVDRDRLDLLVDILDRLEQGYDAWVATH
jgi:hypothetical protein